MTPARQRLAAAGFFALNTAVASYLTLRHEVPGEPLGYRAPGGLGKQLALGWGSGLAAPWPMPATALLAALQPGERRWHGVAFRVIGGILLAGTAVEPVTWGRRAHPPVVYVPVVGNLVSAVALLRAGARGSGRAPTDPFLGSQA